MVSAHRLALAAALATALFYIAYGFFAYFFADYAVQLMAQLHMMRCGIAERVIRVDTVNIVSGFLQSVIFTYLYTFLAAFLYNRIAKK